MPKKRKKEVVKTEEIADPSGSSTRRVIFFVFVIALVFSATLWFFFTSKPQQPKQVDNHEKNETCENDQKSGSEVSQMRPSISPIFDGVSAPKLAQIPRRPWPEAKEFIARNEAVVITGSSFASPAWEKWNLRYIKEALSRYKKKMLSVVLSATELFQFSHDRIMFGRNVGGFDATRINFPTSQSAKQFFKLLSNIKKGKDPKTRRYKKYLSGSDRKRYGNQAVKHAYLVLHMGSAGKDEFHSHVPPQLKGDMRQFDWELARDVIMAGPTGVTETSVNWTSSQLFFGSPGLVQRAHYDAVTNLYTQTYGKKRVVLFPPNDFYAMYVYPLGHAYHRQTQVNISDPDLEKFPLFATAHPQETILSPGELLYLPPFWFHQFDTPAGDFISVHQWSETPLKSWNPDRFGKFPEFHDSIGRIHIEEAVLRSIATLCMSAEERASSTCCWNGPKCHPRLCKHPDLCMSEYFRHVGQAKLLRQSTDKTQTQIQQSERALAKAAPPHFDELGRQLAQEVEEFLAARRPQSPFLRKFSAQDAIEMVAGSGRWDNIAVRSTPGGAADMMSAMENMRKSPHHKPSLF